MNRACIVTDHAQPSTGQSGPRHLTRLAIRAGLRHRSGSLAAAGRQCTLAETQEQGSPAFHRRVGESRRHGYQRRNWRTSVSRKKCTICVSLSRGTLCKANRGTHQDYTRQRIGIVEMKRVKCCEVCYSMGISVTVWTFAPVAIGISVEDTYG